MDIDIKLKYVFKHSNLAITFRCVEKSTSCSNVQMMYEATASSFSGMVTSIEEHETEKPTFDLSLTGEVDETEAALEAEFEAIEKNMQIEDISSSS